MPDTGDRAATDLTALYRNLTDAQANGLACIFCGDDYTTSTVPHAPVGRSTAGSQVFACVTHLLDDARREAIETIRDALSFPYAAIDALSQTRRYNLAEARREAVFTAARAIVMHGDSLDVIRGAVAALRLRIAQTPVVYETLTGPHSGAAIASVR